MAEVELVATWREPDTGKRRRKVTRAEVRNDGTFAFEFKAPIELGDQPLTVTVRRIRERG